jgi:hypothetical protein
MGAAGDLLLTLVGVLVVLFGSIEVATGCLIAFWLLVPGLLIVPYGPHFLLVDRLVLWVFALRLLLRSGRPDQPTGRAFALTPLHGAMAALLVAAYTAGVLLAPRSVSLAGDLHAFLYVLDLVILFVVVLAAVRTIGVRRVVNLIAWGVLVAVLIGFIERTTKFSYGQFFFEHLPLSYIPSIAPGTLSVRGAAVRSQGAAQFALEYGWVLAMLLPLTVVATIRWSQGREPWRKMVVLLPIAVFVAVVFSGGRSAVIAAAVATLVFLVFTGGDRRILRMLGVIAVAAVLVALFDPSLVTAPFSAGSAADPASVRLERLPFLFSLVVHRPFTGLGFNGVSNVFGGVDNGYALMYATIGVVGVTAWIALMVTAVATTARTLRSPRGTDSRNVGAACLIGIVAVAFAMATYDLVSTLQSQWALVFLAAVGVAAAETVPRPERVRRRWGYRAALPLVGLGVGCLLFVSAPLTSSQAFSVILTAPWLDFTNGGPVDAYDGTALSDTLCGALTNPDVVAAGTRVDCLQLDTIEPLAFPAEALVTVSAGTPAAVTAEARHAFAPISSHMQMTATASESIQTGRAAWATTAPLWCAVAGLLLMLLVPALPFRRRTRYPEESEPDDPDWSDVEDWLEGYSVAR